MKTKYTNDRAVQFGVGIDRWDMDETVRQAEKLIAGGGVHQHVVVNAAKLIAAKNDPQLRTIINECDIVNPDGQAVVWASRLLGDPLPERVAGIDFMERMLRSAAENNYSVYLLGATESVVSRLARSVQERGVRLAGFSDGYWRDRRSDADLVSEISSSSPDIIFVALPSPLKEIFLGENLNAIGARLNVGVGGSFDVMVGKTKRAPLLWQKLGMEWAFRLAQEPKRMFKRYLKGNTLFLCYLAIEFWNRRIRAGV